MRSNRFVSAAAAAALMTGATVALGGVAEAAPPAPLTGQDSAPTSVTLPTGDRVTVFPDGTAGVESAPGREDIAFTFPPSPSGDLVVVPTDRAEALLAGEEDPRRYNVTELLASGHTDAAAVAESELDDRAYEGLVPDSSGPATYAEDDLRKLHVSLRTADGEIPDGAEVYWENAAGGFEVIEIEPSGGTSIAVPFGESFVNAVYWKDDSDTGRRETYVGVISVNIPEEAEDTTVVEIDGADAQPVSIEVDQPDAAFAGGMLTLQVENDEYGVIFGTDLGSRDDAFVFPTAELTGLQQGFDYAPMLTSPNGAEDPYQYNLAFLDTEGVPEDTEYRVADEELAKVDTGYRDLGTALDGYVCEYGDSIERQISPRVCAMVPVSLPSQRTVYYTADPATVWQMFLDAGEINEFGQVVDGFMTIDQQVFEPGRSERVTPRGGLSTPAIEAVRVNEPGNEYISGWAPLGGGNGERLLLGGATASYTLSRDGEVLGTAEQYDPYLEYIDVSVPAGDTGRYTLAVEARASAATTEYGTEITSTWEFDSAPAELELDYLALPSVVLTSEAVEGGEAPRDGCQEVTLELVPSLGAMDTDAVDMTLEISYDDGATWKSVRLDREGDIAEAHLWHPRGAQYASIRTSATDDNGTEVTSTVIRAYGLR